MEYFHLTTPQQNIWNLQKYYNGTAIANLCGAVFFQEKRDEILLCKAVCRFIHSQSGIRLRFHEGEKPRQYVSEEVNEDIPVRTFRSREEFDVYAESCAKDPIELAERQMYRFVVFHLEQENRSGILAVLSHLVSDAWTFGLMANQVDMAYRLLAGEGDVILLKGDYADFIQSEDAYLVSGRYEKDKNYWEGKYPVRPEESPVKLRSASADSVEAGRITRTLPPSLEQGIASYCKSHPVTEAVLFETALIIYLSRINPDTQTVTVGVPVLNRSNAREKKIAGMFVSTMPLTVAVTGDIEISELAGQITKGHMDLFRHQKYPYAGILRQIRKNQTFTGNLYDVMVSYQNAKTKTGADTKWYSNGYSDVPLLIHVDNRDGKECHTINVDYQTAVFRDKTEVELLMNRLEYILGQLVVETVEKVKDIKIIPQREYDRIVYEFNDTYVDYPREKCVHELFMEQAAKTPERTALVFEDKKFTYKQLDEMSNSLAHMLRNNGVKRNDIIPIISIRSWHYVVATLAVLKAGGAFMPIDPRFPKDRIFAMLEDVDSDTVLVYGEDIVTDDREFINLGEVDYGVDIESVVVVNQIEDLCYIIFTSGTTGKPKGSAIKHNNLVNFIDINDKNEYQKSILENCGVFLADIAFIFDPHVFHIFLPLVNGLTMVLTPEDVRGDEIAQIMVRDACDTMNCTPTQLNIYMQSKNFQKAFAQIRILSLGAEVFTDKLREDILNYTDAMIYNVYGPTETTIISTFKKINHGNNYCAHESSVKQAKKANKSALVFDDAVMSSGSAFLENLQGMKAYSNAKAYNPLRPGECNDRSGEGDCMEDITIGKPIANTQIYILNKDSSVLPIGVAGELCIAGEGVGKGYLNHPELTTERFVPNPFATKENNHGEVMYRTGDLARFRSDGEIEYLGRMDTQVKIRGQRIELGEIESVIGSFPGIGLCAVADKRDETDRQYLVGYYTTVVDEEVGEMWKGKVDERQLRRYLSSKLPRYMVPNYFIHLSELPMTPSGKLDRKNLPVPQVKMVELTEYVQPVTELEKNLCQIMEKVLGYEPIGLQHDFFAYGGDSLKAMEFIVRAEEQQIRIKLQDIFDYPTVEEMVKSFSQEQRQEKYIREDFCKYEELLSRNQVCERYEQPECSVKTVLLSGITGFLGAHIADELLKDPECIVYCLVRSEDSDNRRGRVPQILEYYFGDKYADVIGARILPVVGDITDEKLSDELPEKIDMVIHAAATVKHYGSYEYFYKVNTLGTKHMADYAMRTGARFVHISTISVSGNSLADSFDTEIALEERHFGEDCLYQGQSLENVYVRSKFEAECVVLDAMLQGLQANIIRVGNLTNRSRDYIFQPNYTENAFLSRIKAALELGCMPDYMLPLYSEFSPVDDTADAIVRIARHFNMHHTVFHVYSDRNLYFDRMLEILEELSVNMKVVDGETFTERLKETVSQDRAYIYEAFLNDMDSNGKINYETNIHIENAFTLSYLKQLGFEWPKIDYAYVKGYLEYFIGLGYLEMDL